MKNIIVSDAIEPSLATQARRHWMPDRVLIVGAGPTGLTAALELSGLGVPVRIIDKRAALPETKLDAVVNPLGRDIV
jgi:heterodisulfide reductase subunit A-like polyferredoxin